MLDIHTNDCTQLRVGLINPRARPKLGYAYYTLRTIIYRGQQLGRKCTYSTYTYVYISTDINTQVSCIGLKANLYTDRPAHC